MSESAYVYRCKIGLMNVKENKSRIKPNIKSLRVIHKPLEYGRERGAQKSRLLSLWITLFKKLRLKILWVPVEYVARQLKLSENSDSDYTRVTLNIKNPKDESF